MNSQFYLFMNWADEIRPTIVLHIVDPQTVHIHLEIAIYVEYELIEGCAD